MVAYRDRVPWPEGVQNLGGHFSLPFVGLLDGDYGEHGSP